MTAFKIKDLQLGDRFYGADGHCWTVSSNRDGILTAVRTGRTHRGDVTGEAGEKEVEVINRDDELTLDQAAQNFQAAKMVEGGRILEDIDTKGLT